MVMRFKNCKFSGNGGHGMVVIGNHDVDAEDTEFLDNTGDGVRFVENVPLTKQLGLPEDTSPQELAELLQALLAVPGAQRQSAVESSSLFQRWTKRGMDAASLASNLVTIVSQPTVHDVIKKLLGLP